MTSSGKKSVSIKDERSRTKLPPRHARAKVAPSRTIAGSTDAAAALAPPTKAVLPSTLADVVGSGLAAFENIILPTPPQITGVRQMDTLRMMGLRQPEGQQRRAYRYLQPSGAGKSTCARLLAAHVEGQPDRDPEMKPVLHVTLSTTGTPKSLASSILGALGDNYSTRGEAELLLRRVRQGLKEFGVELLIIDELNHFRQKHLATDAANTIKNILTLGWVPIVLMGTTDAQSLFTNNRELKMRSAPQVVLAPYDHRNAADLEIWTEFLRRLDARMVQDGILSTRSGLGESTLAKDLCEASNGLIGELHNIILAALEPVLMVGEKYISYERLSDAVDAWCLQDGTIEHNPLKIRAGR